MKGVITNEMTPHHPPTSVVRVSSWKCFFAQSGQTLPFTDLWNRTISAPMFWWNSTRPTGPILPQDSQRVAANGGGVPAEGGVGGAGGIAAASGPSALSAVERGDGVEGMGGGDANPDDRSIASRQRGHKRSART